jgi:hypothetical protein
MSKRFAIPHEPILGTRADSVYRPFYERVKTEAIRAQAAEDALQERVRVLEGACRDSLTHLHDAKRQIAPTTTNSIVDDHLARLKALVGGEGEG